MNNIFGGYTGAGYTYGGDSSDENHSSGENSISYLKTSSDENPSSDGNNGNTSDSNGLDGGYMSEGSVFSGGETNVKSIATVGLTGGAFQNKKDFNQSWFIEKHRLPNKSKSRDHNKFDELVEIIYEALKSQN